MPSSMMDIGTPNAEWNMVIQSLTLKSLPPRIPMKHLVSTNCFRNSIGQELLMVTHFSTIHLMTESIREGTTTEHLLSALTSGFTNHVGSGNVIDIDETLIHDFRRGL